VGDLRDKDEASCPFCSVERYHVQDYAQTTFAKLITDSGIEVSGMFTNASERASAFIGLGEGVAGNKFKETLIKAAANAKK
jgi:hypothetical protein